MTAATAYHGMRRVDAPLPRRDSRTGAARGRRIVQVCACSTFALANCSQDAVVAIGHSRLTGRTAGLVGLLREITTRAAATMNIALKKMM